MRRARPRDLVAGRFFRPRRLGPPTHDSTPDTLEHIRRVQALLADVQHRLNHRGRVHDQTKLEEPEKSAFDRATTHLRSVTYGSREYEASRAALKPALQHHYAHNSHHPEHHADGIAGMTLLDLIEMLVDWKAASERHDDGDIRRSLRLNEDRFGISPQLAQILVNTVDELYPQEDP